MGWRILIDASGRWRHRHLALTHGRMSAGLKAYSADGPQLLDVPPIDEDRVDERAAARLVALLHHELHDVHLEVTPAELERLGDDHVRAKAPEVERAQDLQ